MLPALRAASSIIEACRSDGDAPVKGRSCRRIPVLTAEAFSRASCQATMTLSGNNWSVRELIKIWFWRQSKRLVSGECILAAAAIRSGSAPASYPVDCGHTGAPSWWSWQVDEDEPRRGKPPHAAAAADRSFRYGAA